MQRKLAQDTKVSARVVAASIFSLTDTAPIHSIFFSVRSHIFVFYFFRSFT